MPAKPREKLSRGSKIAASILILISIILVVMFFIAQHNKNNSPENDLHPAQIHAIINSPTILDINKLENDEKTQSLIRERKKEFGIDKGIDLIIKSSETLKIGQKSVAMQDILEKIILEQDGLIEKNLAGQDNKKDNKQDNKKDTFFGVYIVRPGDNIWNIHFNFLKDYLGHRGISISPIADEPDLKGFSSGVGKILKFSENMVYIYNIKEKKLDIDLNLIYSQNKIVIYNMTQIFNLLNQIDYDHVNRIEFDGETIWIPSDQ